MIQLEVSDEDARLLAEACRYLTWKRFGDTEGSGQVWRHEKADRFRTLHRLIDEELGENQEYWQTIDEMHSD